MLRISKERVDRGWSMMRLASEAALHVSTISIIESGHFRPYPGQIEKLVVALDWKGNPNDLFKEVEDL